MPDVAPHNMTSDSAPAPYVTSASAFYSSLNPFHAFDGALSAGKYWLNNGGATGWLKIDLGAGNLNRLTHYELQMNTVPENNRAPKDWTLQGSINDSDWDIIDTVTGETGWTSGELRQFSCDVQDTEYRFFKIVVTDNNGGTYLQIGEEYLYGAPLPTHALSGTVAEKGSPVIRTLRAYNRSTGELFSTTVSAENGTFSLDAPDGTTEMYVIALDDDAGEDYNALIYDRVKGVAI